MNGQSMHQADPTACARIGFDIQKKGEETMRKKRILGLLLSVAMMLSVSGCDSGNGNKKAEEKIQITVEYMCGRMNLDLESVLEEKFPQVDIVTD